MNDLLTAWHAAAEADAAAAILPCNGSRAWALRMARQRPFESETALLHAADATWWSLTAEEWQQAFDSHPRIGEQHARAAIGTSLQWSATEQSAAGTDAALKAALREGNRAYEQRFGRIFLICASGKSAPEILASLQARLAHDDATELHEAAEQQRRITQLRLRKWLALPPAGCESV